MKKLISLRILPRVRIVHVNVPIVRVEVRITGRLRIMTGNVRTPSAAAAAWEALVCFFHPDLSGYSPLNPKGLWFMLK